jgi:hypothetical protein
MAVGANLLISDANDPWRRLAKEAQAYPSIGRAPVLLLLKSLGSIAFGGGA